MFILFQIAVVQLVSNFYGISLIQDLDLIVPVAQAQEKQVKTETIKELPIRLKIPSLHVNAVISAVGVLPNGSMGLPRIPSETAWYKLGPKPGDVGSAVISGHVNWWYGAYAVFAKLKALKPGDKISVQDNHGKISNFVVRTSRLFGQKDDATNVFYSYDGKSHLNLVTCAGVWISSIQMYSKRLVVFADKVEE